MIAGQADNTFLGGAESHAANLECREIVYRALLSRKWVNTDTRQARAAAFLRRKNKDLHGLSVHRASACNVEYVVRSFNKCHGIVSLQVGRVRDLLLDVIPDDSIHANITGLPWHEEEPARAEYLAGLLAKQTRLIYPQ